MDKKSFEARLQQVLDNRDLPDCDATLRQFAEADEAVAARLRVAELIASPPTAVMYPTADFADRILARIHEEDLLEVQQRRAPVWKKRSFWWSLAGIATAASVLVAVGFLNSGEVSGTAGSPETSPLLAEKEQPSEKSLEAAPRAEGLPTWEDSKLAFAGISKKLDVRQEKVAQLQQGLTPLRCTLNVTIHVFKSTVPDRRHAPASRPTEGQPSSSIVSVRWVA